MDQLRKTAKVEVLDEDLKKYAAEVEKKRKAMADQKNGVVAVPPAEGEGDTGGKGDLQIPEQ
jgi:hypothetical protein